MSNLTERDWCWILVGFIVATPFNRWLTVRIGDAVGRWLRMRKLRKLLKKAAKS